MYNQSTRQREDNKQRIRLIDNLWNDGICIFSLTNEICKPTDTGHKTYTNSLLEKYIFNHITVNLQDSKDRR